MAGWREWGLPQPISLAQQALVWFTTLAPKWETGGDGGTTVEMRWDPLKKDGFVGHFRSLQ
jgi:hypothetical protein